MPLANLLDNASIRASIDRIEAISPYLRSASDKAMLDALYREKAKRDEKGDAS
jgi:hypothetical protein